MRQRPETAPCGLSIGRLRDSGGGAGAGGESSGDLQPRDLAPAPPHVGGLLSRVTRSGRVVTRISHFSDDWFCNDPSWA
jgi:hypothetical protein